METVARHDYPTQGYDISRSGWNPRETMLTVESVKTLRLLFTQPVDGQVFAQPLYAQNLQMPDGSQHNVVIVATAANSVYAFDADNNDGINAPPLWQVALSPDGGGPVQAPDELDGCDNIVPLVGIIATPVLDVATSTVYVVAKSRSDGDFHFRLHALDLTTGVEKDNSPADIQLDNFDPRWENNRAGLLLNSGRLYMAFGAHCDRGTYHGWVLAYDAQLLTQLAAFNCTPNSGNPDTGFGGIWQCGIGLSSDEDDYVYCTTGNGAFTADGGGQDFGNSILKLGPDLSLVDYFTPFNQARLCAMDWDLGSGGPVVVPEQAGAPHPRLLAACGKQGVIYLLDRAGQMGKYNGPDGPDQAVQTTALYPDRVPTGPGRPAGSDAATPGVYGGAGYYAGPNGPRLYFCGSNGPIVAFVLDNASLTPQVLGDGTMNQSQESYMGQVDASSIPTAAGGATPVVSSNADMPGTGVVWAVTRHGPLLLRAYDAEDLRVPIYEGEAGTWDNVHGCPFTVPTVIEGKVYVGTADHLAVFGM